MVPADVGQKPTYCDWHGGVSACYGEEDGDVVYDGREVRDEEDYEARHSDAGGKDGEEEAMGQVV